MLALRKLKTKLLNSVGGRVYLPAEFSLRSSKSRHGIKHRYPVAHKHDVDVAIDSFITRSDRTEQEREADLVPNRLEGLAKYLSQAERLSGETTQFVKNRAVLVHLKICLAPFNSSDDDSGPDQLPEFALYPSAPTTQCADDLLMIETPIDLTEQKPQHGLASGAKKR